MQIWKLNSCPKCKTGVLFLGGDNYGKFLTCGNCGWQLPQAKDDVETDREGIEDGCNIAPSCLQCPLPD
jgi:hypothetical protein